jgi:hypothetical protein
MLNLKKKRSADLKELQQIKDLVATASGQISIYRDLISFPVTIARAGYDFEGGLVDSKSLQLVNQGILNRSNKAAQTIPPDHHGHAIFIERLPVINHTVLYGGLLLDNFGHFLLESIGRLWAYDVFKAINPYILFYTPWGIKKYKEKQNYIYQALRGFGIPVDRILFAEQIALYKTVIVPDQKYGFGLCRTPDETFLNFLDSFHIPSHSVKTVNKADRIYVSRSKLPIQLGRPLCEVFFEKYLAEQGYLIFYPEQHTLYEQIALYKTAKKIIFCDGGATYCTILLPKLVADIAIVARRRDHRGNYRDITEHFFGFKKSVLWIDEVTGQYQFGKETWDSAGEIDWHKASETLHLNGFVDATFIEPPPVEYADVKRKELLQFIQSIEHSRLFLSFMEGQKQQYPVLPSVLYELPE